jgi:cytochrome P450
LLDPWLGYKQLRDALRDVLRRPLTPRAPRPVRDEVTAEAERLVEKLVAQGSFDAATDLANHLPVTVVSNLIGLPPRRPRADAGLGRGDVQLLRADE